MIASDLINDLILPLRTSDSGNTALVWMEELRLSHLPIVNNEQFLGLVSEKDIYNMKDLDDPVGSLNLTLVKPYVLEDQHLFEVLRLLSSLKLSIIPVLDINESYLGCITLTRLMAEMASIGSLDQPGGIIVLKMNAPDYSMHEISRIVESNDAKVLSCYSKSIADSTQLEVTLKINKIDISAVIQTFNRYEYDISASFSEESNYDDLIKERYGALMNYLNI